MVIPNDISANIVLMLRRRGYTQFGESVPYKPNSEFGGLSFTARGPPPLSDLRILILEYIGTATKAIGKNPIKQVLLDLATEKGLTEEDLLEVSKGLICVTNKQVTKAYMDLMANGEQFEWSFFKHDLLNHVLQPTFKLMRKAEAKEFMKHIRENQMPKIRLGDDAVVRYFAAKAGDLFCITDQWGRLSYRLVS
jgi:DNA-directed RNA polymerase subunit H (RpoH/RPB5)